MAIPVRNNLDMGNNQLLSVLAEVLSSAPGSGPEGRLYYNSTSKLLSWHNGSAYISPLLSTTRLDQIAVPTAPVALNGQKITGLADGTSATDGAAWGQVQALLQGVRWLASRASSMANVALPPGGTTLTIDGVALANGDYVLLKNQTAPAENGLYVVSGIGTSAVLTRAGEMNVAGEIDGRIVITEDGTQAGSMWITVSEVTSLGVDPITFTRFNAATDIVGGSGLTLSGLTLDVNVDGSSIEINTDILRVKALGITNAMLAGLIDLTSKVTGALPLVNGGLGVDASSAGGKTTARANIGSTGKYSTDITGNAVLTQFTVTHGLGTTDVHVSVWDVVANSMLLADVTRIDANNVRVDFSAAPANGKVYRVVVIG